MTKPKFFACLQSVGTTSASASRPHGPSPVGAMGQSANVQGDALKSSGGAALDQASDQSRRPKSAHSKKRNRKRVLERRRRKAGYRRLTRPTAGSKIAGRRMIDKRR